MATNPIDEIVLAGGYTAKDQGQKTLHSQKAVDIVTGSG